MRVSFIVNWSPKGLLSHSHIWSAIEALASRNNLSPSGLARLAGLDPTSFNKSKRQGADGRLRWPSTESLAKIMQATGTSFDDFARLVGDTEDGRYDGLPSGNFPQQSSGIPLLGFAQAGAGGYFDDAGFPAGQGWEQVDFPTQDADKNNVYALEVQGESMMPLYRDGDVLIVEPNAQIRKGDRIVVRTKDGEVMAKILSRDTAQSIELLSLNPEHPNRQFAKTEIDWTARIIWASQ
jgi:phage repressor protein C with HTH and peptisase S24 domain